MGACFQAPHATPGQRPMETLTLSHLMFSLAWFPSFAQNYQQVAGTCWNFCADGLFGAPYNVSQGQGEKGEKNNNKFWQQK